MSATEYDEKALFEWFVATDGQSWDFSEGGKAVWIAYYFDQQVINGGFDQAFLNDGHRWRETRVALVTIGAMRILRMFDEALALFPSEGPSMDADARFTQMRELREVSGDVFHRLTGEYYDLYLSHPGENMYAVMYDFLVRQDLLPWKGSKSK